MTKAREKLGWQPQVTFRALIQRMVRADDADVQDALKGRVPNT